MRNGHSFMIPMEYGMVFRQQTMQSVSIWLCVIVVSFLLWELLSSSSMGHEVFQRALHGCKHKHQQFPNSILHKSDTIYAKVCGV